MPILDMLTSVAMTGRPGPARCGARLDDAAAVIGDPWDIGSMKPVQAVAPAGRLR